LEKQVIFLLGKKCGVWIFRGTCFCIFWVSEVAEVKTVADAGLSKDWIWFIFGFSMIVSFADTLSQLQNKDATHESAKK
jgi:hypothetical protein